MPKYALATEEVAPIADELMREHHGHLLTAKFGYLFQDKAPKSKGKLTLASVCIFPEKFMPFFPGDEEKNFLLTVSADVWNRADLSQRIALIDHELSHCWGEEDENTGEMVWTVVGHDFEEFSAVIRRHGIWKADLEQARETFAAARPIRPDLPDLTQAPLCHDEDGREIYENGGPKKGKGKRRGGRTVVLTGQAAVEGAERLFGRKATLGGVSVSFGTTPQTDLEELIRAREQAKRSPVATAERMVSTLSGLGSGAAIELIRAGLDTCTDKFGALDLFEKGELAGAARTPVLDEIRRLRADLSSQLDAMYPRTPAPEPAAADPIPVVG